MQQQEQYLQSIACLIVVEYKIWVRMRVVSFIVCIYNFQFKVSFNSFFYEWIKVHVRFSCMYLKAAKHYYLSTQAIHIASACGISNLLIHVYIIIYVHI